MGPPSQPECWPLNQSVAKLTGMKARHRVYLAALVGAAVVLPHYVAQFERGYVGLNYFPLLVGFTDLPHCPYCDNFHLGFPLLEMAAVSALVFGIASLPLVLKKRKKT
jgi:hypothetical protein